MRCIIFIIKRNLLLNRKFKTQGMAFYKSLSRYRYMLVFHVNGNKYNSTNETSFAHYHLVSCFSSPEEVIITKFFYRYRFHKSDIYFTKSVAEREIYFYTISPIHHLIRQCIFCSATEHNAFLRII